SINVLLEAGVRNPRIALTADAALLVEPAPRPRVEEILRGAGLDPNGAILALNVSDYLDSWGGVSRKPLMSEEFVDAYADALVHVYKELNVPMVFIGTQHHDVPLSNAIIEKIKDKVRITSISNIDFNHFEIMGVLGAVSLLFGMRLHSLILAS